MNNCVYIHLDTGAAVVCTNKAGELNDCVPTDFSCGTAANDEGSKVIGLGTFGYVCESLKGTKIRFMFTNSLEVPNFKRRSLSIYVLRDIGYDASHLVLSSGSYLWVSKVSTRKDASTSPPGLQFPLVDDMDEHSMLFPLVQHNKADFLKIKVVTGAAHIKGEQPAHDFQVQAINLAQSLTGDKLWWLMHIRMGCPGVDYLKAMFAHQTVKCLTAKEHHAPEATNCPVCFNELTRSRRMNPIPK